MMVETNITNEAPSDNTQITSVNSQVIESNADAVSNSLADNALAENREVNGLPPADSQTADLPVAFQMPNLTDESPQWAEGFQSSFGAKVKELGLSDEAQGKAYEMYYNEEVAREAQTKADNVACRETLAKQYGEDTGRQIGLAIQMADQLGIREALTTSDLANNPKVLSAFAELAQLKGLVSSPGGDTGINQGVSNDDLESQISECRNHPSYLQDTKVGRALNQKVLTLMGQRR